MDEHGAEAPVDFQRKWTEAYPEFALALRFMPQGQRAVHGAVHCIGFELAQAAYRIRDNGVAATKLEWWADELTRISQGSPRHPLTQKLVGSPEAARVPTSLWNSLILGALRQRDADPASDINGLLGGYEHFLGPLAQIHAACLGSGDAAVATRVLVLDRALREVAALPQVLEQGRLPLSMDLLARHQLARGDLAGDSTARRAAIRDFLADVARELKALPASRQLPLPLIATARADRARARSALAGRDPLAELERRFGHLPFVTLWAVWRGAHHFLR